MAWHDLGPCYGVLEIRGRDRLELELHVFWGDGQARTSWLWSQSGRIAWWSEVGEA